MASLCVFLSPSAAAFRLTNGTAKSVAAITLNIPLRSICASPWFDRGYFSTNRQGGGKALLRFTPDPAGSRLPFRADGRARRTWYADDLEFDRLKMFRRSPRLEGGIHDQQHDQQSENTRVTYA